MPKHGGSTVEELLRRHVAAVEHIASSFNRLIGVFGEGLGGYVVFYLALAHAGAKSIVCQNSPAIMNERMYHDALVSETGPWAGAARRRKFMMPVGRLAVRALPNLKLPVSSYLDWKAIIDPRNGSRQIEQRLVDAYLRDPDFDTSYPLAAVMSLISTAPPKPLANLEIPTMFLLSLLGPTRSYIRQLYARLPSVQKTLVEVDGSVYWMLSHPKEEARIVCEWFARTMG